MALYTYPGQPAPLQQTQASFPVLSTSKQVIAANIPVQKSEKSVSVSAVSPQTASKALRRMLASELRDVGYERAPADVIQRLEWETEAFLQEVFGHAQAYANLCNRPGPSTADVSTALTEFGLSPSVLRGTQLRNQRKSKKRKHKSLAPSLVTTRSRHNSPEVLSSDDEQDTIPPSLKYQIDSRYPTLPPRHTYKRTPALPPKKAALPSLEKKLKTTSLVQDSLQHLLLATEQNEDEDADLLGHIVNWEKNIPRKRWKV